MRIDLRGRKVRVAEHHLNGPQIGPAFQQVCSKRMTHDVRAERARKPGAQTVRLENLPEADAAERPAPCVDEHSQRLPALTLHQLRACLFTIPLDPSGCLRADRHEALLVTLADARQIFLVEMKVVDANGDEL